MNIPLENSYAFGYGLHDLKMIEYVGHGIAMENAVADVVRLAKYLKTIK